MNKQDERNLTLIESAQVDAELKNARKSSRQTNPITKKFLDFHISDEHKFSVKNLFKWN